MFSIPQLQSSVTWCVTPQFFSGMGMLELRIFLAGLGTQCNSGMLWGIPYAIAQSFRADARRTTTQSFLQLCSSYTFRLAIKPAPLGRLHHPISTGRSARIEQIIHLLRVYSLQWIAWGIHHRQVRGIRRHRIPIIFGICSGLFFLAREGPRSRFPGGHWTHS